MRVWRIHQVAWISIIKPWRKYLLSRFLKFSFGKRHCHIFSSSSLEQKTLKFLRKLDNCTFKWIDDIKLSPAYGLVLILYISGIQNIFCTQMHFRLWFCLLICELNLNTSCEWITRVHFRDMKWVLVYSVFKRRWFQELLKLQYLLRLEYKLLCFFVLILGNNGFNKLHILP